MTLILSGTNGVSDVDGSASTPAIRGTDSNTGIFFPAADTIAFAEGGVEVARFDSSGNFGIGTSSPGYRLDVSGGHARIRGAQALFWGNSDNTNLVAIYNGGSSGASNGQMIFECNSVERARIDSSGNLLVGCTSLPSSSVVGFGYDLPNRQVKSSVGSTSNTFQLVFFNPNGTVGSITTSGSATAFNTSSDYRLKENVQPMVGALARVAALKPCTYTWKVDGSAGEGFIAHELAEVVPDAVTGEKDAVDADGNIVPQGIDTSFLVATLTAAIQEQQALIESLTARIAALEGRPQ